MHADCTLLQDSHMLEKQRLVPVIPFKADERLFAKLSKEYIFLETSEMESVVVFNMSILAG